MSHEAAAILLVLIGALMVILADISLIKSRLDKRLASEIARPLFYIGVVVSFCGVIMLLHSMRLHFGA